MRTNTFIVVFGYLRLSVDEVGKTVSGSIENQAKYHPKVLCAA